jgi:hypothetical protein
MAFAKVRAVCVCVCVERLLCGVGRVLYDNLKKTVAYTLAHLWPEILPVMMTLAFSMPLGLTGLVSGRARCVERL